MRRIPFYLTQMQVRDLARSLYTLQHVTDVTAGDHPATDRHFQLLTELRRQCCVRSGAEDPFPGMELEPSIFDGVRQRRNA